MTNCGYYCAISFLIIGQVIGYGVSVELRCYCNLPACVHTAYMCKSEKGCFQQLPYGANSENRSPRIGCLELWSRKRPFHCVGLKLSRDDTSHFTSTTTTTTTTRPELEKRRGKGKLSFLRCCMEDMCNYVPQSEPELNISVLKTEEEVSISVQEGPNYAKKSSVGGVSGAENISERLWFRAAVIAVPICGGIILMILIAMASTLLSSDWRKVSDNDRLLPSSVVVENERCTSPAAFQEIQPKCQKLLYSRPFPSYLRGQLRHYHSDTTLVFCNEKTKQRPNTVFFPGV